MAAVHAPRLLVKWHQRGAALSTVYSRGVRDATRVRGTTARPRAGVSGNCNIAHVYSSRAVRLHTRTAGMDHSGSETEEDEVANPAPPSRNIRSVAAPSADDADRAAASAAAQTAQDKAAAATAAAQASTQAKERVAVWVTQKEQATAHTKSTAEAAAEAEAAAQSAEEAAKREAEQGAEPPAKKAKRAPKPTAAGWKAAISAHEFDRMRLLVGDQRFSLKDIQEAECADPPSSPDLTYLSPPHPSPLCPVHALPRGGPPSPMAVSLPSSAT